MNQSLQQVYSVLSLRRHTRISQEDYFYRKEFRLMILFQNNKMVRFFLGIKRRLYNRRQKKLKAQKISSIEIRSTRNNGEDFELDHNTFILCPGFSVGVQRCLSYTIYILSFSSV
jgi:hypothetical protein